MNTLNAFALEMYQKHFLDSFIPKLPAEALTKAIKQLTEVAEAARQLSIEERSTLTWSTLEAAEQLKETGLDESKIEQLYVFAQAINQPI